MVMIKMNGKEEMLSTVILVLRQEQTKKTSQNAPKLIPTEVYWFGLEDKSSHFFVVVQFSEINQVTREKKKKTVFWNHVTRYLHVSFQ